LYSTISLLIIKFLYLLYISILKENFHNDVINSESSFKGLSEDREILFLGLLAVSVSIQHPAQVHRVIDLFIAL